MLHILVLTVFNVEPNAKLSKLLIGCLIGYSIFRLFFVLQSKNNKENILNSVITFKIVFY